jgi:hypothetical protein
MKGNIEQWNSGAVAGFDNRSMDHMLHYRLPPLRRTLLAAQLVLKKEYRNPFLPDLPIDYSDSDPQMQVLLHHYLNEFDGNKNHLEEVARDYDPDSVIYEVVDNSPKAYRGRQGVEQMCRDMLGKVKNIELQHVAVNHNHAQVIWKGETLSHSTILGTDSFTFDDQNHITKQTIVALTEENGAS